ncbi:WecB/TagA/CpsF family glycosyltransferase [Roseibacterium sp. SDUM158017]|uniref:WecB/TagA/CpsF family glycosyltransferase n=1 Tax=Roseicyclus salinarum TaxID=3036773 RepID=UPI0024151776|nr:WecB/TagA/CpsF family glycosyltransferase [Roseibacterium sp. SDUM158017]MDG4649639.1 WecB/TagA/CpsF family glycosyltransferase [Roseibacterium sp. SDUM158017]
MALLEAITVPSQAALLEDLRSRLVRRQGFAVATMNLDHAVKLRQDPSFRRAYAAQTHVTADGRPVVWLSRLAGRRISLVTGSDLVEPLVALCADLGVPLALLGATPETLAKAADRLRASHAGLDIPALLSPPMGFDPESAKADALIEDLGRSGTRLCLLALGAPKQEIFAARALRALPAVGFVSVGAGIDFVAGTQRRAPRLVRALALEWLWRLSNDPRRLFRRYASCVAILPALARGALSMRSGSGAGRTP